MTQPILNIAAYKFFALENREALRESLRNQARAMGLKGTILLAPEGINLFLAGDEAVVEAFLNILLAIPGAAPLEVKRSWSDTQPFGKMLVKLKKEIISLGRPEISPVHQPAPRISPTELKRWLDQGHDDKGRPVVMLDTRNGFEVDHGTFDGAVDIRLENFRSFGTRVRELDPALKDKTIVSFCTGGIRCEKAAPLLVSEGFPEVYQLDGGILKYFEECGGAHYHGDCYVFDERVALDPALDPSLAPQT